MEEERIRQNQRAVEKLVAKAPKSSVETQVGSIGNSRGQTKTEAQGTGCKRDAEGAREGGEFGENREPFKSRTGDTRSPSWTRRRSRGGGGREEKERHAEPGNGPGASAESVASCSVPSKIDGRSPSWAVSGEGGLWAEPLPVCWGGSGGSARLWSSRAEVIWLSSSSSSSPRSCRGTWTGQSEGESCLSQSRWRRRGGDSSLVGD